MATLNPADLTVDESLPSYSTPISLTSKPPISDDDVKDGRPLRLAARKKVSDSLSDVINEQKRIKSDIEDKWSSYTDAQKHKAQTQLDFFNKNKDYLNLVKFLKTELVWWDNNLEVSSRDINTRDTKFDETSASLMRKVIAKRESIGDAHGEKNKRLDKEKKEKQKANINRTVYDDVTDSFTAIMNSMYLIIYILVGLRCASFAANEILYKPLPYRVIVFIYTFLFAPIFGFYYLWKAIKSMFWGIPFPRYEGFFPMTPYDPSEPLTINRRLFGYADTPVLKQWMADQLEIEQKGRDEAVVSKHIKQDIIQERSQ